MQADGVSHFVADTAAFVQQGIREVRLASDNGVIAVSGDFITRAGGVQEIAILELAVSRSGPSARGDLSQRGSDAVGQRLTTVLLIHVAKLGGDLPWKWLPEVLDLLCDPTFSTASMDWDAGGRDSLRYLLQQQYYSQGRQGLDTPGLRHFNVQVVTRMDEWQWLDALLHLEYVRPSLASTSCYWKVGEARLRVW